MRDNHRLLAAYCESRVAKELLESENAVLIPDGTARQGVGQIAASTLKVGEKIRALKSAKIEKGDRNNWANTIVYMLKRLATSSSSNVETVWKKVSAILSDLCKVNKNLAIEIQSIIGSRWKPGQIFCNLHYTLGISQGIRSVMNSYQQTIGVEKHFPKTVGFEIEIEDKLIVVQVLDCWMRLTSIRWQIKPWNRYQSFTEFGEKRGIRNGGHMLHANRFGEFEERCAGGVYMADAWIDWLNVNTDTRNQLSCYLRDTLGIMDQCKFLWAGAAIIGIQLTQPFISMLLDHKVTPRNLIDILPTLYQNLKEYPESLCKISDCGIPALKLYFFNPNVKETSIYGTDVSQGLTDYLKTCDQSLMDLYLKTLCSTLGDTLKRQRGNQYGFGDDPNSEDLVTNNLPCALLDDGNVTTTMSIENFFGNLDRELQKIGQIGFSKANNDLVIKYSKDLNESGVYRWRTKANKKKSKEMNYLEKEFDESQKRLLERNVEESDVVTITQKNRVLQCISSCKDKHNGPITTIEELDKLVKQFEGNEKLLKASLNAEIRLRKLTLTNVKLSCPLFRQIKLPLQEKIENLKILIESQLDMKVLADMNDLEDAIRGAEASTEMEKPMSSILPGSINVGEYVVGLFEDGFYPGEVLKIENGYVTADFLAPVILKQNVNDASLWKRPSSVSADIHKLEEDSILPIRPVLEISKFSNSRLVIYELLNVDLVEKFV